MRRSYKIIRNHIITGFIFLMPVFISIAIIGKFWNKLLELSHKVSKVFGVETLLGVTGATIIAVVLFLILCIIAGFLVKLTVFKKLSDWFDEKLARFIPGYNDLRKETETKIGVGPKGEVFETCLVRTPEYWKPAYLIEIAHSGDATVFIPAAPTFNTGQVLIVPGGSYRKLKINSQLLNSCLSKFGKGISEQAQDVSTI